MWCLCARKTQNATPPLQTHSKLSACYAYPLSDLTKANLRRQSATKQARVKCEPDNLEKHSAVEAALKLITLTVRAA
jgi:hypothetical protein